MAIVSAHCFGQQKNQSRRFQFHSINNFGLINGQADPALQIQTINGLQHKSWFGGIGLGLDYYRLRSIPLFVDVRKEFGKTKDRFFLFADAGTNFYWKRDKDAKQFYEEDKFKNGFYGEVGAGYKIKLNQKFSLISSLSFNYKKLIEKGRNYFYCDPMACPITSLPPPEEKIDYNLNRLVFKAGIEF
ncbi:MAG TPA: hypothetical protein VKT28_18860 [Puia sp.]|nr:hypothetical protein [Puia sp.]